MVGAPGEPGAPAARRPSSPGFVRAGAIVLGLVLLGTLFRSLAFEAFARGSWLFSGLLAGSALFAALFLWSSRESALRFLRSMQVGVTLVVASAAAVLTGVLVPQIEGFENPGRRVTAESWEADYQAFRWAEGYFLYHLKHLYGIGLPRSELPAPALEGLARYERRYGAEEASNRRKQMQAALSGREKTAEIRAFLERHERLLGWAFWLSTVLELNRLYKSHWFATLLTLLFVAILCNTFRGDRGAWLTLRKVGWTSVHLGVATLLAGGMLSNLFTIRGILHLDTRAPPTDEYWAWFDRAQPRRLPFHVKVERFARRDWKTLNVHFPEERFGSRPPDMTLWPGRVIELDYVEDEAALSADGLRPRLRLEVLELHERALAAAPRLWEADGEEGARGLGPLVELEVQDAHAPEAGDAVGPPETAPRTVYLHPSEERGTFLDPAWRFRLTTDFAREPAELRERLAPAPEPALLGRMRMRLATEGVETERVHAVRLGEVLEGPGGYRVELLEARADFRLDPADPSRELRDARPLAEEPPRNPAVWVRITPPEGAAESEPERRVVLEALDPISHGLQQGFRHSELVLELEWDRWRAPGPPRFVLGWRADGSATLVDEAGGEQQLRPGEALALPGPTRLVPRAFYANAAVERRFRFSDPPIRGPRYDESFYSQDPTGAVLFVTSDPGTPEERSQRVELASTEEGLANRWQAPDGRFVLHYFENERVFPFEWRSVLSLWEPGPDGRLRAIDAGPESEREIRVNDYLHHRGWRFFQTNAIPELPTYSGIGVVYDPGIPVVLYGMYLIIAGTVLAFLVRPIVERRREARRGNAEAAA